MLRPTVARAFAPREDRLTLDRDPAGPQGRLEAVNRLFLDLHREFVQRVTSRVASMQAQPWRGEGNHLERRRNFDYGPLRVSKEHSLAEGVEFVVETPQGSFRFLNTLASIVWIHQIVGDRLVPREILSVQLTGEGHQPIRKFPEARKSGFRFTSVRALVDVYLSDQPF